MSVLNRRYAVERADREGMSQDRPEVPVAGISESPGTVVRRAQAGGSSAPDDYRADHGYKAIPTYPQVVIRYIRTNLGVEL